ncbi:MAG: hypothetical protein AB1938_17430 [Myxococcota bacterium]
MRWLCLALVALGACKRPAALEPRDAGLVPGQARAVKPAPPAPSLQHAALAELHDAGWRLAWISERSGAPQVVVDGVEVTSGPAAHYLGAVVAGGAGFIVTAVEGGQEELRWVLPDAGVRVLAPSSLRARHPSLPADGRFVVFESGVGGLSRLERVELGDGGVGTLADEPTGVFEPSVAPDGAWLVYVSSREGDSELYRAAIDGSRAQRLTAFHLEDFGPRVSPDGRWIAFLSNREGFDRVFLVRPDGRGQRRLISSDWHGPASHDAGPVEAGEQDVAWAPDSCRVALAARTAGDHWHLLTVDVATGVATVLSAGAWDDHQPAFSPDGKFLAFVSTRGGSPEVWLMRPDGGVTQVSADGAPDWRPMFVRWWP